MLAVFQFTLVSKNYVLRNQRVCFILMILPKPDDCMLPKRMNGFIAQQSEIPSQIL